MEKNEKNKRTHEVLLTVTAIPKYLVHLHGIDNLTEFLLHNLGQKNCFNFSKAAYFIDNPDFDCLQGVAGFTQVESYQQKKNHWHEQEAFSAHMNESAFNKQVKDVCRCSLKKNKQPEESVIKELSDRLEMSNPEYLMWPVKYENHGILLFEKGLPEEADTHLHDALHLFGFCSVM